MLKNFYSCNIRKNKSLIKNLLKTIGIEYLINFDIDNNHQNICLWLLDSLVCMSIDFDNWKFQSFHINHYYCYYGRGFGYPSVFDFKIRYMNRLKVFILNINTFKEFDNDENNILGQTYNSWVKVFRL